MQEIISENPTKNTQPVFDLAFGARALMAVGGGVAVGGLLYGQPGSLLGGLFGLLAVFLAEKHSA